MMLPAQIWTFPEGGRFREDYHVTIDERRGMAIEVYWTPCGPPEVMQQIGMHFREPDLLLRELAAQADTTNARRNFMSCPSFLRSMTNVFVWRNGIESHVKFEGDQIVPAPGTNSNSSLFQFMPNSRIGRKHIKYGCGDVLFFCSQPLVFSTFPAFMHETDFQMKLRFIPGSFDISKWFRPAEGEYELMNGVSELSLLIGDPYFYVQFHTNETIKFIRFEATEEMNVIGQGCMRYKNYRPNASLAKLYEVFCESNTNEALLDLIKSAVKQPR